MNIITPLLAGAAELAEMPGSSITSVLKAIGDVTGLFGDGPDGGLGLVTSGAAGIAAAFAVAIALLVHVHTGDRTPRDVVKHVAAIVIAFALVAFVVSDMREASLAYLGINPAKPAVEFEIRLPKAALPAISDTQVELQTDRNQKLARVVGADDVSGGQAVLRGVVTLDYRTTDRIVVLSLAGRTQCEFKLRLAAEPSRSDAFGPWHLADRVGVANGAADANTHDAYAIRYRVL